MKSKHSSATSQFQGIRNLPSLDSNNSRIDNISCTHPAGCARKEPFTAHPSLTINNSISSIDKGIAGYTQEEKNKEYETYKEKIDPLLSVYHRKGQNRMQHIIEQSAVRYGQQSIASIDLTFGEQYDGKPPSFDYANKCLNSLLTNVFRKRYSSVEGGKHYNNFLIVCERGGKRGRVHFHLLVVKQGTDFFTGSYKGKRGVRDTFHPNQACRDEWAFLRNVVVGYGFGARVRVQPLWNVEKGSKYFTKYVGKGHYSRNEEMKGRQLIRYGNGFSRWHSMKFSKLHGAPRDRRIVLENLGLRYARYDLLELNKLFGSRWQYYAGDQMRFACSMARKRSLPPQTITFLKAYLWNRFKLKLFYEKVGSFKFVVHGAFKYEIRDSEAMRWISRSDQAPDDVYEQIGFYTLNSLKQYAWRNLCGKIESDYMGEATFTDLPLVGEVHKLTHNNNNETKQQTKQHIEGHGKTSIGPFKQLEFDGHLN